MKNMKNQYINNITEWKALHKEFRNMVYDNQHYSLANVELAFRYETLANLAFENENFETVCKYMDLYSNIAKQYIKEHTKSEWDVEIIKVEPIQQNGESYNLVKELGYANGATITKNLNSLGSTLIQYKPYNNLTKEQRDAILQSIADINNRAFVLFYK